MGKSTANLLVKEKALTRQRDKLTAQILKMPRVKIVKDYVFQTSKGKKTLAELFGKKTQLLIKYQTKYAHSLLTLSRPIRETLFERKNLIASLH